MADYQTYFAQRDLKRILFKNGCHGVITLTLNGLKSFAAKKQIINWKPSYIKPGQDTSLLTLDGRTQKMLIKCALETHACNI